MAAGEMQRLAERVVAGGLAAYGRAEGGALLGVEVEPVAGGVVQAHPGHGERGTREMSNRVAGAGPPPRRGAAHGDRRVNIITNSIE